MQLMTTAYNIFDIKIFYFLSLKRRHKVFENLIEFISFFYLTFITVYSRFIFFEKDFFVLYSIRRYN